MRLRSARSLIAALLAAFVLAEIGVRAIYAYAWRQTARHPMLYERVYWKDVPPWVRAESIFTADPEVGLWMKPHLDREYINLFGPIGDLADVGPMFTKLIPKIPAWARERPVWRLTTNSLGIRNAEVSPTKPPATFRVVVLGDSWTVGANLDVEQTFVRRLADLLGTGLPVGRVDVINYGVMGGRAETGRRLIPRVLGLAPDLVVIAYAQNDENDARGKAPAFHFDIADLPLRTRLSIGWSNLLGHVESYQLLSYFRTREPAAVERSLEHSITTSGRRGETDMRLPCVEPGTGAQPYRDSIDAIVTAALDRGVDVVLLYNNLPEWASHCTLTVLAGIARERGVPLVDSSALLAAKRAQLRADAERRRDLVPAPPDRRDTRDVTIVLRVDMRGEPGRPRVMGNLASLGNFAPNQVELFDDGTHGDQRAGDGVWSLAVDAPLPARLVYLYTNGTPGTWTGLENYEPRVFTVPPGNAGHTLYAPIAEFGRMALRSDPAHPDALGASLIAEALAETVRARPSWTRFRATDAPAR